MKSYYNNKKEKIRVVVELKALVKNEELSKQLNQIIKFERVITLITQIEAQDLSVEKSLKIYEEFKELLINTPYYQQLEAMIERNSDYNKYKEHN